MLRPNPVTGVMEDDGLGPLPLAPPILQATPESTGGGAPAMAGVTIVAPPEETHRVEQTGPQVTQAIASPEVKKDMAALEVAHGRASEARAVQGDQKVADAEQQITLAEQQRAQAAQEAEQVRLAREAHKREVDAKVAEKEKRRAEEERLSHPRTYWEDKGVPARILGGLLMMVGGAASGLARQSNGAVEAYRQAEQDDRQRKIEAFKNSTEFRRLAEHDIEAAKVAFADKLAEITQNGISARNLLVKNADVLAKRTGLPGVRAGADQLKAEADARDIQDRLKLRQHYDQTVQSGRQTTSDTVNVNKGASAKDLTVFDLKGKPGQARSDEEAKEMREGRAALESARAIAEKLKAINVDRDKGTFGRLNALVSTSEINTEIGNLLEKKHGVLGALTESDQARAKSNFSTSLRGGPAAAAKALDAFIGGMEKSYDEAYANKAVGSGPGPVGGGAPAKAAPSAAPAAQPKRSRAEATGDLARVTKAMQGLPKNSPDRTRLEALRKRIIEQGDAP